MAEEKRLLVVGGSGFIGRYLVSAALNEQCVPTVLSLHHVESDRQIDGVNYLVADVSNYDVLASVLAGLSFTHVVNLGGYVNHSKYREGGREVFDAHFIGVQNLVQCLDWNILESFVQIGSSDEYGDAVSPQKESTREMPISAYSMGKVAAGQLLQMLNRTEGFPVVILRLFLVYGPEQNNQRFLPQIISGCLKGESFATSYGEQVRDFCYVDDVVRGIFLALSNSSINGEVINLASGEPVQIKSMLEQVLDIVGNGSPRYGELPYRDGENMSLYADVTKAKSLLSWEPRINLNEGLKRTMSYYKKEL